MSATNHKPLPARPPEIEPLAVPGKPTPARALAGPRGGDAELSAPRDATGARGTGADVPEVSLEVDGSTWRVRVVGRSGRAGSRSPPLLVLGFWPPGECGPEHAREAVVVARTLAELTDARLQEAHGASKPPPLPDRMKPFFDGVNGGGRGGGPRRES